MTIRFISAVVLAVAVGACSSAEPPALVQTGTKRVDPATTGSVAGRITFTGTVPEPVVLSTASDRACDQGGGPLYDESLLVGADEGLQNAFVYIKDGLDDYIFDVPTEPFVLDQKGCKYEPHVFGVRAGQPIEIRNSDETLHNVHAMPQVNREFNQGMPLQGMKLNQVFTAPEVGVPFKCDVHGWMESYAGIVAHPYYMVTDDSGTFTLPDLPPGTYTLEVWHETLGTQSQQITIEPNTAAEVAFTFAG